MSDIKQSHVRAVRLVKFVCNELQKKEQEKEKEKEMDFVQDFFIPENSTAILHLAVENGVFELVEKCLKAFPDLIWYADKPRKSVPWNDATQHADTPTASSNPPEYPGTTSRHRKWHEGQDADTATATGTGRLLLHVAIEHRRVEIFNYLIAYIGKNTKAYADLKLEGNNNSLHLAAKLAPTLQLQSIPGPAFQMQQEFQWFRAVEELVYEELKTEKNLDDKTPRELFFNEHKDLLKDAKEWMKDTSNSCMVVGALVATVSFAAVITVPGGNDNATGVAILARNKLFMVFLVSNTISLANSAASLLMFLSVQTSRYTEEDFLESLPQTFVRGLFILFIAIVTMMISFGTAIGLSLQSSFKWAHIATFIVACFPAIILGMSHLPLLLQSAAGPAISRGQRDREH
ncbi:ankyrin repeat-containing protein NPR4-like [Coffea eugenioides]|uniref:ankyrin repeat-containing protein NPR4-like n=1 Tax=Coffea eugenioides TaxID=49369 RepID=UPI000F60E5C9|nr:ankyrin repeat-containing protein NPR4-like [Coffea eugenioides]